MTTKQAIFEAIEQVPEQQLVDVLRYVQQLARIEKSPSVNQHSNGSNPLANFIGEVSHGSLAANLDDELYGD